VTACRSCEGNLHRGVWPLAPASFAPQVVLVRLNARGMMTVKNKRGAGAGDRGPNRHMPTSLRWPKKNEQRGGMRVVGCAR